MVDRWRMDAEGGRRGSGAAMLEDEGRFAGMLVGRPTMNADRRRGRRRTGGKEVVLVYRCCCIQQVDQVSSRSSSACRYRNLPVLRSDSNQICNANRSSSVLCHVLYVPDSVAISCSSCDILDTPATIFHRLRNPRISFSSFISPPYLFAIHHRPTLHTAT